MSVAEEVKTLREMLERHIASVTTQRQNIQGRPRDPEQLDPVPMEGATQGPPGPPPMAEQIQAYVREVVSAQAAEEDLGTFAQEDDFEEEEPELLSLSGFEVHDYEMEDEIVVDDPSPPPESPQEPSVEGTPTVATPSPDAPASVPPATSTSPTEANRQ